MTLRPLSRALASCTVLLCFLAALTEGVASAQPAAAPPAASAASSEQLSEAKGHFKRGVKLFKEKDFRNALLEFRRAYEVVPNHQVHFNIGQAALELRDYALALRSFQAFVAAETRDTTRIDAAKREIEQLKVRVATLSITASVTGAEVLIDDVLAGKTPLEPQVVSAGRRKVTLTWKNQTRTRVVDLVGGDNSQLSFTFEEAAAPPAEAKPVVAPKPAPAPSAAKPPVTPAPEPEAQGLPTGFWIGMSLAGALAVGGAVTGVLALDAKSTYDKRLVQPGVTREDLDSPWHKGQALALTTDLLFGVAILTAGTTAVLTFAVFPESRVEARLVATPGFTGVVGSF